MDSQTLVQELQRLQNGESGAETRVLFVISRSNLYLLTENDPNAAEDADSLTITARVHNVNGQPTAYFFSSEAMLQQWCKQKGVPPYALPIHGADVSVTLGKETWIEIDPDTPYSARLDPEQLNSLQDAGKTESMGLILAAPEDDGFVSPIKPEAPVGMPAVYKPLETELKEQTPAGPAKKRFIPRAHPTTLFAAPQIQKKEELTVEKQQSYTTSKLKKVIRSDKGTDRDDE